MNLTKNGRELRFSRMVGSSRPISGTVL